jgi:hypothetical protein
MRSMTWLAAPFVLVAIGIALAADGEGEKPAETDTAPGIAWVEDLATAKELAAKQGKPLLLYFTFDT